MIRNSNVRQAKKQQQKRFRQQKIQRSQQYQQSSGTHYPSSSENQKLQRRRIPFMQHLSQKQQQIVTQYVQSVQNKTLKFLLTERQQILQQLRSINNHLNQMISKVYGDLQNINQNQKPYPQHQVENVIIQQESLQNQETNQQSINFKNFKTNNSRYANGSLTQKSIDNMTLQELQNIQLKNEKVLQTLCQEIKDYEFMLTGQYYQKLQKQITNQQLYKKSLNQQYIQLSNEVKKYTRQYDKQRLEKIEKVIYGGQHQLVILNKKLESKLKKLKQVEKQSLQKQKKVQKLEYEQLDISKLLQMYEDQEYQNSDQAQNKRLNFQKLNTKKQKLQKIINSYNNNHLKLYNRKLVDFRSIDLKIQKVQQNIQQMEYNIILINKQKQQFEQENNSILKQHNKKKQSMVQIKRNSFSYNQKLTKKQLQKIEVNHKSLYERNKKKQVKFQNNLQSKSSGQQQLRSDQDPFILKNLNKSYRKRIYTQLENSHYFSSLQRNKHIKKRINTQNQVHTRTYQNQYEKKQIEKSPFQLKHAFNPKGEVIIPTKDQNQSFHSNSRLSSHQRKLNSKFSLSKAQSYSSQIKPISILQQQKQNKSIQNESYYSKYNAERQQNTNYKGSFSQHTLNVKQKLAKNLDQLRQSDLQQIRKLRQKMQNTQSNRAQKVLRKGVSLQRKQLQDDMMDLDKRIINLQKLLNKSQREKNQQYRNLSFSGKVIKENTQIQKNFNLHDKNVINGSGKYFKDRNAKMQMDRKLSGMRGQSRNKKSKGYYKQLLQKLGKEKLLIEEEEDISGLLYEGMRGRQN